MSEFQDASAAPSGSEVLSVSRLTDQQEQALLVVAKAAATFVDTHRHESWEFEELRSVLERARRLW
jgi:hypothetical protein